jgi:uncharacterized protein
MAEEFPAVVPIFPLNGAVLMPRAILPLNIFEPRYLAMTRDAIAGHKFVGMVQPKAEGRTPPVYETGCLGRINEWQETEDGRILMTLVGVTRFRVVEELPVTTLYRQVRIDCGVFTPDLVEANDLPPATRKQLFDHLRQFLDARGLAADWSAVKSASDETLVSALTMLCPFSAAEKQALLEAENLPQRTDILSSLLTFSTKSTLLSDDGPAVKH